MSTLTTDSKFEARGGLRIGTTGTTVGHVFTVTDTVGNATFQAPTGGGGVSYTEVTGTSQTIAVNTGYILNNAALVTATLPSTSAVGNIVRVVGKGAGGWRIAQPAGVNIRFIDIASTTGVGGSVSSTASYDSVELVCTTANTTWTVASAVGNLTIL